jgi:ferredoxin
MRVLVERAKCQGHAMCLAYAPGVFELDELGYNVHDGILEVPDEQAGPTRRAAAACPERVITVMESDPVGLPDRRAGAR